MSLIVARKQGENIIIVSDTKLSPNEHKNNVNQSNDGLNGFNVLKSIILSPSICISFAGGEMDAEVAFKSLKTTDSIEDIKVKLVNQHLISDAKTDFILAINSQKKEIFEIKGNKLQEIEAAWIGDYGAFKKFQESNVGQKKNLLTSMDDVINDPNINSVGGFKVSISIRAGKFDYDDYMKANFAPMTITSQNNIPTIIGNGTAERGDYSLTFIGHSIDYNSVAFYIHQGKFGIVYTRVNSGLLRPIIKTNVDEVDFYDHIERHYGIYPKIRTQSKYAKYRFEGIEAYNKGNYKLAIACFEKAIESTDGAQKAELLLNKGKALVILRKEKEYTQAFNEAILLVPNMYYEISIFMQKNITIK